MGFRVIDKAMGRQKYMCGKAEQALFSRSSSTSGTDSSLRIRKGSARQRASAGCTERRWFICVSLAMIFTVMVASAGIYFGYEFLRSHLPSTEDVFRGSFTVLEGDFLPEGVAEAGSYVHETKSAFYQNKLDLVISGSDLSQRYLQSEVFLLEGHGEDGMTVHFNVHMDPAKGETMPEELTDVILGEILYAQNNTDAVLSDVVIDEESLDIQERSPAAATTPSYRDTPGLVFGEHDHGGHDHYGHHHGHHDHGHGGAGVSRVGGIEDNLIEGGGGMEDPPRQCMPFQVDYCRKLPYNFTSFPNAMSHADVHEAKHDIEMFKRIVDSDCYALSYEFVCQLLQPVCFQERLVLPCRDFCVEFLDNCGNTLPGDLRDRIRCDVFKTEADGPGACISKPGCVAELRNAGREGRVCDGVVDCPDFSDELYCPYCPEHHFHCGVGKHCIEKSKMCDGNPDCDNGADEKGCLSLAPHMDFASYVHQYYSSGFIVYQQGGASGKVCADDMVNSVPDGNIGGILDKLGKSMCNMLEYRDLEGVEIVEDQEEEDEEGDAAGGGEEDQIRYVDMMGPMSEDRSFVEVPCHSRSVVKVECTNLECGRRPAHVKEPSARMSVSDDSTTSTALHGDWPWHVALYKNGQHVCDGILISERWIMTTASCFQGQGKAKWAARFATVRLTSRAPWEQKRRIVGMVKSPVEGNSVVILKMDSPVVFSDFTRPICLPSSDDFIHLGATCVTLGWGAKRQQLHVVGLEPAPREKCEEESEVAANTICTQEKVEGAECRGEEVAGAPLMCQVGAEWHLVGVSAWRKSCSSIAQRPRLYDKVAINSDWARKTMGQLEKADEHIARHSRRRGRKRT